MQAARTKRTENRARDVAARRDQTTDAVSRPCSESAESVRERRTDLQIDRLAERRDKDDILSGSQRAPHVSARSRPPSTARTAEQHVGVELERQDTLLR